MVRRKRRSAIGQILYNLRYRIGEYAQRGTVAALPYLPARFMELVTWFMARVTFVLLWKYRVRMHENLALALGSEISDAAERRVLVWRAWQSFARALLDTIAVLHDPPEKIVSKIALEGEEHIKRALEKGKGVVALSAHLGSFTLIGARLAAAGYPFSVVVKQPADERFARLIDGYRTRIGIHTISAKPRREAVRGILKALRKNCIVLVIADEFKSGDVIVDFFGLRVPAPRGPAALALRTGAVTLPMFATRREQGRLVLSVGAPIEPIEREDVEQSVVATTALYTRHLEAAIRRFPDQWNWLGLPQRRVKKPRTELARSRRHGRKNRGVKRDPGERKTGTS
jgi:Kdo2-lipid IVA lauroyltransferase/acyltransferase